MGTSHHSKLSYTFASSRPTGSYSSVIMKVFVLLAFVAAASAAPAFWPGSNVVVSPSVLSPTVYSSGISYSGFPNTFYTGASQLPISSLPITTYSAASPLVYSSPVVAPVQAAVIPKTVAQTPGSSVEG